MEPFTVSFTIFFDGESIRLGYHRVLDTSHVMAKGGLWAPLSIPFATMEQLRIRLKESGLPEEIADSRPGHCKHYFVNSHLLAQVGFPFVL